eukprot:5592528-Pleurochrysis_carterae.AAC.1
MARLLAYARISLPLQARARTSDYACAQTHTHTHTHTHSGRKASSHLATERPRNLSELGHAPF